MTGESRYTVLLSEGRYVGDCILTQMQHEEDADLLVCRVLLSVLSAAGLEKRTIELGEELTLKQYDGGINFRNYRTPTAIFSMETGRALSLIGAPHKTTYTIKPYWGES